MLSSSFSAISSSLPGSQSPWRHRLAIRAIRPAASRKKPKPLRNVVGRHIETKTHGSLSHLEKVSEIRRAERRGLSLSGALLGSRAHAGTDRDMRREHRARRRVVGPGHGEEKERERETGRNEEGTKTTKTMISTGLFFDPRSSEFFFSFTFFSKKFNSANTLTAADLEEPGRPRIRRATASSGIPRSRLLCCWRHSFPYHQFFRLRLRLLLLRRRHRRRGRKKRRR